MRPYSCLHVRLCSGSLLATFPKLFHSQISWVGPKLSLFFGTSKLIVRESVKIGELIQLLLDVQENLKGLTWQALKLSCHHRLRLDTVDGTKPELSTL